MPGAPKSCNVEMLQQACLQYAKAHDICTQLLYIFFYVQYELSIYTDIYIFAQYTYYMHISLYCMYAYSYLHVFSGYRIPTISAILRKINLFFCVGKPLGVRGLHACSLGLVYP